MDLHHHRELRGLVSCLLDDWEEELELRAGVSPASPRYKGGTSMLRLRSKSRRGRTCTSTKHSSSAIPAITMAPTKMEAAAGLSPAYHGFADRSLDPQARCHRLVGLQGFAPCPCRLKVCCAAVTPQPRRNGARRENRTPDSGLADRRVASTPCTHESGGLGGIRPRVASLRGKHPH